jgi:hypothetical protein
VNEALASANIVSLVLAHTPRQENCLSNSAHQIFFSHLKKDLDIVKESSKNTHAGGTATIETRASSREKIFKEPK